MLVDFFYHLRSQQLPVSVKEYLTLLQALGEPLMAPSLEDFYYLARTTLVKDEALFDRFDRAFGSYYRAQQKKLGGKEIPLDWLVKEVERRLTDEQKAEIEKHGWDKLMEMFKERLDEQQGRHAGGNRWIGSLSRHETQWPATAPRAADTRGVGPRRVSPRAAAGSARCRAVTALSCLVYPHH